LTDFDAKHHGEAGSGGKAAGRSETPFRWWANCGMDAYAQLAGVPHHLLFRDADAIIEAYRKGRPLAEELFGPDVGMGPPSWAGVSYGHLNTLGSELVFPEDGQVAPTPIYHSLEEGIRALKREVDFIREGMFPFYLKLWDELKKAFPDENVPFGMFKGEGPLTTAWLLRGHDFFTDVLEYPAQAKEYIRLATESAARYNLVYRKINGGEEYFQAGVWVGDDVPGMISPALWPDLVLPYLELYFAMQTKGKRSAHMEDLKPEHLKYLDALRLDYYDPSVSPKLSPAVIRDRCNVPFAWRLTAMHYPRLSASEIERWVVESAADGASVVFTGVESVLCTPEDAEKVRAFARAAKAVERMLAEGVPREQLRNRVPVS